MTRHARHQRQLERIEAKPAVIPPSLERAFSEIERPALRYADTMPARAIVPRTAQDGR